MTNRHPFNKTSDESPILATRVLTEIEHKHVTPRARWTYTFRNHALWIAAVLAIVVAALSAAAMIFILANAGWRYAPATKGSIFSLLLVVLPSVWLGALILFIIAGYWNIRHTVRGYRYPLSFIVIGVALLAVLTGAVLFSAGFGQEVEEGIGKHIPFYQPFLEQERSWWLDTDRGLLTGKVIKLAPDFSSFVLRTNSGTVWYINASDLHSTDVTVLARGGIVRVVGIPEAATSTAPFHACFVFPWKVYGALSKSPPPLFVSSSSTSEIILRGTRSELCKGVRPYKSLRALEQGE